MTKRRGKDPNFNTILKWVKEIMTKYEFNEVEKTL